MKNSERRVDRGTKPTIKLKFREPNKLSNPSEKLYKLAEKKYQKMAGSRSIAPHLKKDETNKSHSFNILLLGIKKLFDPNYFKSTANRKRSQRIILVAIIQ